MTYQIDRIDNRTEGVNLKGWKIIRSDGQTLQPFTTKAAAQQLLSFFSEVNDER